MRLRRALCASLAWLALAGLAGCGEAPAEVYAAATEAAEAKDFDAFTGWFTERSAELLRGLDEAADASRGRYEYLRDLYDVLPEGDVLSEEQKGSLTILTVGRNERTAEEVILLRETDGWRIDIVDSPRFWKPLVTEKKAGAVR